VEDLLVVTLAMILLTFLMVQVVDLEEVGHLMVFYLLMVHQILMALKEVMPLRTAFQAWEEGLLVEEHLKYVLVEDLLDLRILMVLKEVMPLQMVFQAWVG
jgi:hypothetical protein